MIVPLRPGGLRLRCLVLIAALVAAGCSAPPDPVLLEASADATLSSEEARSSPTAATLDLDGASEANPPPPFTVVAQAGVAAITAHQDSDAASAVVAEFSNPTAVGSPLVFRALDGSTDGSSEWIEVHLPVQPNGTTGWVRRAEVTLSNNPYRVQIDRASYSLQVFRQNVLWLETTVAIGTGDTPTPVGDFYLLELLAPPDPSGPYGPFAFGLSGFSEVLDSFGGADTAIIGLHGTNEPSSIGTNVSHGCVRLENSVIERLAQTLPLGTPVLIT